MFKDFFENFDFFYIINYFCLLIPVFLIVWLSFNLRKSAETAIIWNVDDGFYSVAKCISYTNTSGTLQTGTNSTRCYEILLVNESDEKFLIKVSEFSSTDFAKCSMLVENDIVYISNNDLFFTDFKTFEEANDYVNNSSGSVSENSLEIFQ